MDIADRYAALKVQIEALEVELKSVHKQIVSEGKEVIEGEHAQVMLTPSERVTLRTNDVKKLLNPEQILACVKTLDKDAVEKILTPAQIKACSDAKLILSVTYKIKMPGV
jgi:hypothetical protein